MILLIAGIFFAAAVVVGVIADRWLKEAARDLAEAADYYRRANEIHVTTLKLLEFTKSRDSHYLN